MAAAFADEEALLVKSGLYEMCRMLGLRVEEFTAAPVMIERALLTLQKGLRRNDASWLYEDKTLADCTIRVTICGDGETPVRRPPAADTQVASPRGVVAVGIVEEGASAAPVQPNIACDKATSQDVRLIRAHSAVLSMHSRYFQASLSGGWKEGSQSTIDVSVGSEEAFQDFELLIKLAYGPSYVMLDSRPLEKDVLLRLLPLADSFEFLGFLDACIDSLCENLTAQEVFECLEAVPQTLWADDRFRRFLEDAADVVADDLGYLDELFQAGSASHSDEPDANLPLKVAAQALPPFFLEYLMASEGLKVRSENDTFALAMACLDYHVQHGTLTETEAQTYCNGILNRLRFHWMSLHFLSRVVALHPRVALSGQLPEIMGSSLAHRVNPTYLRQPAFEHLSFGPPDRSCTERSKFKLSAVFSLEQECMKLEAGGHVSRWVGLAQGYPVSIDVGRHKGKDGAADMVSVGLIVHFVQAFDMLGKLRIHASMHHTGMNTNPIAWGGLVGGRGRLTFDGVFAKKPWMEAIRDGSPFFEDGNVTFDVELDFARELEA